VRKGAEPRRSTHPVSLEEASALKSYHKHLRAIEAQIGNGVTYTSQLNKMGHHLFDNLYAGTFSSDTVPRLSVKTPYCIANVDTSNKSGSHWIAIVHTPKGKLVYDSFGRKTRTLTPNIWKQFKTIDADYDVEQAESQSNCGARCMSFISVAHELGPAAARLI
jgi:hypothetical protein